jgi:iron-sulfur cluster assembly protein
LKVPALVFVSIMSIVFAWAVTELTEKLACGMSLLILKNNLYWIGYLMITLTETAVAKVKEMLVRRGRGMGIMIGVKTTGCSGLAYTLEYVDDPITDQDHVKYDNQGIGVWTDAKSLVYLDGLTMDWAKKGLNEGFEFVNPNESARCGCGESFTV